MFDTAFTLGLTQFARSLSFPERLQRRTARNGMLEPWRARNTSIDSIFYDVGTLTAEEIYYISDSIAAEGLTMIVPPAGGPMLTICDSVEEFFARGGKSVKTLAVAGMGGSAVGAAAFARNVADAVGTPVAAVVSGYGLGDIVSESMGASFLFGWLGRFRSQCEVIDDVIGRPRFGAYGDRSDAVGGDKRNCLDVDTVDALLTDPRLDLNLLVSHSRGSLVVAEALENMALMDEDRAKQLAGRLKIVTFGARIAMPPGFEDVTDVMGAYDWFGEMNSRPARHSELRISMAGHSTNSDFPAAIRVTAVLKQVLSGASAEAKPAEADAPMKVAALSDGAALATPTPAALPSDPEPPLALVVEAAEEVLEAVAVTMPAEGANAETPDIAAPPQNVAEDAIPPVEAAAVPAETQAAAQPEAAASAKPAAAKAKATRPPTASKSAAREPGAKAKTTVKPAPKPAAVDEERRVLVEQARLTAEKTAAAKAETTRQSYKPAPTASREQKGVMSTKSSARRNRRSGRK